MAPPPSPRKRATTGKARSGTTKSATAKSEAAASDATTSGTKSGTKSGKSGTAKATSARGKQRTAESAGKTPERQATATHNEPTEEGRTLSVSVPSSLDRVVSGAANAVLLPVAVARRVLPAKGGLPLYLGLGALGVADVLDWPVAIGIGVGYAVLRRGNPPVLTSGPGTPKSA